MTRPITVEQHEQADLQLQTESACRGFLIHAAIYVAVQAALITINLVVGGRPRLPVVSVPADRLGHRPDDALPVRLPLVQREVRRHQELVEQRALRLVG